MLSSPTAAVDTSVLADPEWQQLIDDMIVTMRQADGIGLAAPQVGRSVRLAVISADTDPSLSQPLVLVNPTVTVSGSSQIDGEEGCLSIVGVFGIVPRAIEVTVTAFDRHGRIQKFSARDLLARVIQHEVDHLNGVLFISRTDRLTKGQELLS